jgi:hypothetical protein
MRSKITGSHAKNFMLLNDTKGGIFRPKTSRVCEITVLQTQITVVKSEVNCMRSAKK